MSPPAVLDEKDTCCKEEWQPEGISRREAAWCFYLAVCSGHQEGPCWGEGAVGNASVALLHVVAIWVYFLPYTS